VIDTHKEQPGTMSWINRGSSGRPAPGLSSTRGLMVLNNPWGTPPPGDKPDPEPTRPERPRNPWGPQNGNGGGNRGPNGNGQRPPDFNEIIARAQQAVRGMLPPGFGGGRPRGPNGSGGGGGGDFISGIGVRGLGFIVLAVVGVWLASGFYRVQPDEQGVVLRFGAFNRTTLPGLNYHLPWPVESVLRPAVTRINRIDIGYRSGSGDARTVSGRDSPMRDVGEESLMLTGDENIIDINAAVFWRIRDASAFLFNTRNPAVTVKSAAESVMREVIGRTPIQPALTDARAQIEAAVTKGLQGILDQYGSGVEITQVQLQKVDPPAAVIESFRDVQRANTDADRMRNEAESYRNDIVPRARGDAARLTAEADGARQSSIVEATGQAQRFLSVLKAYEAAKDVTMQRLYIETMQEILSKTPTVVVDAGVQGVVPYLPLGEAGRITPPAPAPAVPATVLNPPAPPRGAAK
jgi:membrane protease subunit HflK